MSYSAKLLDHFHHPRRAGELTDATVVAEAANPVCGDVIKLWLRVEAGRVTAVTFKADGCVPAIACGSWLSERLAAGCTLTEARLITAETLSAGLDGLPLASSHAADLVIDVLRKALDVVSQRT